MCRGTVSSDTPIVNVDQAEAWNNDEGRHWSTHQDRYDALNEGFTERLLDAASIGAADAVLDIGCGNGRTTRLAAQRASAGHALGLDLSAPMLERAADTAAAEGITNVAFQRGDAQVHPFDAGAFDVAISRFGVMFFADPVAAFANIARALRPPGRIAFVCWQDLLANEWIMLTAGPALQHVPLPDLGEPGEPGPFSLADPEHTESILAAAGFADVQFDAVEAPMRLGDDAGDAIEFLRGSGVGRSLLEKAEPDAAARAVDAMVAALRPHERPEGLYLNGAAWLVTARKATP